MSDDGAAWSARDAVIREGVSLLALAAVLWYFGPGRMTIAGWRSRVVNLYQSPRDRIDAEVARFRAEVSRWEHEQAAG